MKKCLIRCRNRLLKWRNKRNGRMRDFKWNCAKIKRLGKQVKKSERRNGKRTKFMRLGRRLSRVWSQRSKKLLKGTKRI